MRINKRKAVFVGCIVVILVFMGLYWFSVMEDSGTQTPDLEETEVPQLENEPPQFKSRRQAIDKLREKKASVPPSMYDETLLDSSGTYDPYLREKEKKKLMDSILAFGKEQYDFIPKAMERDSVPAPVEIDSVNNVVDIGFIPGRGHDMFFLSNSINPGRIEEVQIRAEINQDQVIRKDQRVELRVIKSYHNRNYVLQRNTILYGQCSFKTNRLLLTVFPIGNLSQKLEAYDISDGQKGIYIENSFRSRATTEVLDDVIQDINVTGVPQVRGIKSLFQRDNRNVKVKVLHKYQLILKPAL